MNIYYKDDHILDSYEKYIFIESDFDYYLYFFVNLLS